LGLEKNKYSAPRTLPELRLLTFDYWLYEAAAGEEVAVVVREQLCRYPF